MYRRTIKFRGKRLDNGEWFYGSLVQEGGDSYIISFDRTGVQFYRYQIDPETVGQFTGLTDKRAKDIYEGDIVRDILYAPDGRPNGSRGIREVEYIIDHRRKNGFNIGKGETYTVVGNVHDNPEILFK